MDSSTKDVVCLLLFVNVGGIMSTAIDLQEVPDPPNENVDSDNNNVDQVEADLQLLNPLKTTQLRTLYSALRLVKRPSSKAAYIDKIVDIPVNGEQNTISFIKAAAKPLGIKGTDNAIILQLLTENREDIVYRIAPHTAAQWLQRIRNEIQQKDLHPLTVTELAAAFKHHQNRPTTASLTTSTTTQPSAESINQSSDSFSQCYSLLHQIRTEVKSIKSVFKTTDNIDMDGLLTLQLRINVTIENVEMLRHLTAKVNLDLRDNITEISTKTSKLVELYNSRENTLRVDMHQYINSVDDYVDEEVSNEEFEMISKILQTVQLYERNFGEFPPEVQLKVDMLNRIKNPIKRRSDESGGNSAKKYK